MINFFFIALILCFKGAMKIQNSFKCPGCGSSDISTFKNYLTVHNGSRQLFMCNCCKTSFSETSNTAMENLKSPISKVASALRLRSEGLGLRATGRILQSNKRTIAGWEKGFADQQATLMLYSFCHEFVSLTFEGDELYTIFGRRTDPMDSEGWTAVIMDRAGRFIVEQQCGKKDAVLFKSVMKRVSHYVNHTDDLSFLSDGERRYGNTLFALCSEVLQTGKPGRPPKVLYESLRKRRMNFMLRCGQNRVKTLVGPWPFI